MSKAVRDQATIAIGEIAERTGLTVSAIRFYESKGLVRPLRDAGGRRRFRRGDVRRLSFVMIAQQLGFSIREVAEQLNALPDGRTPTRRDWQRISRRFGRILDERIETMQLLRRRLDGCIGCGCLSLKVCSLYNPDDRAASLGAGPRYLLGDSANHQQRAIGASDRRSVHRRR